MKIHLDHDKLQKIFLISFLILCDFLYLWSSIETPTCHGDCQDYVVLMGKNLFSYDYWLTVRDMFRSFTIPFIYSFFGDLTFQRLIYITLFQMFLAFCSWVFFAYSLSSLAHNKAWRLTLFCILMLSIFGRGSSIFNHYILSDSLALSLLLIWLALIIQPHRFISNKLTIFFFILLTFMVAATRDTQSFMILFGIAILLLKQNKPSRYTSSILIISIISIFIMSQISAHDRNQTNMLNIITGTVIPNKEMRIFFQNEGLSFQPALTFSANQHNWNFTNLDIPSFQHEQNNVKENLYNFLPRAKFIYIKYLMTHPHYVLKNLIENRQLILNQSWASELDHPIISKLSLSDNIPLDLFISLTILSFLIWLIFPIKSKKENYLIQCSLILMLAGLTNAIIAFHGDFWELSEMKRHAFIGSIIFKIGGTMMIIESIRLLFEAKMSNKSIGLAYKLKQKNLQ